MKKTLVTIGITVFVIGVALFGTAYLALAQGDDIINACVDKDGALRIVASEEQCKKKETLLSWNVQGQQGPQGEQGPKGEQGEQGPMPRFYTMTNLVEVPGDGAFHGTTARCDFGDVVTGGGYSFLHLDGVDTLISGTNTNTNHPVKSEDKLGEGWTVNVYSNFKAFDVQMRVYAICANLTP